MGDGRAVITFAHLDVEEIKRTAESGSAKRVKREWIKKGYEHQLSLYGALTNRETEETGYSRIEVLMNVPWSYRSVHLIYDFFQALKPPSPYSIWIYDHERDSVRQVGSYK